jgi:hypothetical protein
MIGKCTECGQKCNVIIVDFGIGSYEYWGSRGVDSQIEVVSDCCEAPAVDITGHDITVQQLRNHDLPDPEDWDIR